MARLFRNGVPSDAHVVKHPKDVGRFGMAAFHLVQTALRDVVIIDEGQAWRALRKTYHSQNRNIFISCTKLRETPDVQEMLLTDLILQ